LNSWKRQIRKTRRAESKKPIKKTVSAKEKTEKISKENDLAESTPDTTAVTADPSIEDAQKAEPVLEDEPEDFENADNSTIVEAVEQTEEEKESANQGQEEVEDADSKDSK
jgi:hypothetical protein